MPTPEKVLARQIAWISTPPCRNQNLAQLKKTLPEDKSFI